MGGGDGNTQERSGGGGLAQHHTHQLIRLIAYREQFAVHFDQKRAFEIVPGIDFENIYMLIFFPERINIMIIFSVKIVYFGLYNTYFA